MSKRVNLRARKKRSSGIFSIFSRLDSFTKSIVVVVALLIVSLSLINTMHLNIGQNAAKSTNTGLILVWTGNVSQYAPMNCYHEDSENQREWSGSLAPGQTFTLPMYYCVQSVDGTGPGGATLFTKIQASGPLSLSATDPNGLILPAHDTGIANKSQTYARCYGTHDYNGTQIPPLTEGNWTVTLTNNGTSTIKNIYLDVWAYQQWEFMWPQFGCPRIDWDFTPASISSPTTGSVVSGLLTITAYGSSRFQPIQGSKMNYFIDGTLVGSIDLYSLFQPGGACYSIGYYNQCPISYQLNTKNYRNGSAHILTVQDHSINDNTTSDPVKVTVQN